MSYKVYNKIPQNDFDFLIDQGLKPHHKFLDVGCGAGRIGYPAMTYLDSGNYFAFDKEKSCGSIFTGVNSLPNIRKTSIRKIQPMKAPIGK